MPGLGYVFSIFNSDLMFQLRQLSPFLLLTIGLFLFMSRYLLQLKAGRRLLGGAILVTLAAYAIFSFLVILLPVTGTSYGQAQPVIIVFGILYLLLLDCELIFLFFMLKGSWLTSWRGKFIPAYALANALLLLLLAYAFYVEPLWVDVTQHDITLAKLPANAPPLKVALISDIHMERWTRRETDVLQKLETIQPDMIIIAGDHINVDHYEPEAYQDLNRFFAELHAPFGVYAVAGWIDYYNLNEVLQGTQVKLIDDDYLTVNIRGITLNLVGIRLHGSRVDAPTLQQVDGNLPANNVPKFLLYHTPDLAPKAAELGYDFYFAGHTHGGQIALPFFGAVFTASEYGRKYAAGMYNLGGPAQTRMYVTRGIGMEGINTPRARLFARPEISILNFKGK